MSLQVADMKNSVADRGNAQSSCAGQFIGNHIEVSYLACCLLPACCWRSAQYATRQCVPC
jgi:hypothetical protein